MPDVAVSFRQRQSGLGSAVVEQTKLHLFAVR
jgi:hypothetical protein